MVSIGRALSRRARVATALLSVVALAGCGGSTAAITAPPGVPHPHCGKVTIAMNAWVGYTANAAVVSYVLRHSLGCTVVEKTIDEKKSWEGLAGNSIDVILENWGHDEYKKQYIDDSRVAVELGLTGNKGVIGWYVPPWMAKAYPDITNWKNLNKYAHLFATGPGGPGRFVDGDPTYVSNDGPLIKNLHLNYTVTYLGSEARLIAAFQAAEANHTPLIGYFYEPQWLLSEIKLVHIPLSLYRPGCDTDAKTVVCDYQPYDLDKIGRKKFVDSGSPAAELIKNFNWTNDDQNSVARDMTVDKLSPDDAAKRWLDAHPSVWQKWLPAT